MSTQFCSVLTGTQNTMGGPNLHTPQSIFQHNMSHQSSSMHNEAQWLGMPQIPAMTMPWVLPSSSQQTDLVHFTGRLKNNEISKGSFKSFKRKFDIQSDLDDMRPVKQLITEEKMAQHFKGLHISSNTVNTQEAGPSTSGLNDSLTQSSLDLDFSNSLDSNEGSSEPRLIISDELKRLQQEPILPSSLLNQSISKLERPSMALVLWEPPSRHLHFLPRDTPTSEDNNNNSMNTDNENANDNNNVNNNNESIPDLNQMMEVNALEPMDL